MSDFIGDRKKAKEAKDRNPYLRLRSDYAELEGQLKRCKKMLHERNVTAFQRQELLKNIHEAIVADYVRELLGHPWNGLTERIEEELGDAKS